MKKNIIAFLLSIVAVLGGGYAISQNNLGSVRVGDDYNATSTVNHTTNVPIRDSAIIKGSSGTFARLTIVTAGTAPITFYDATTTNVLARTGNIATSSLQQVYIPASLAVGTYDYDIQLKNGLVITVGAGTVATSTILYR